ncbi:MAG: Het-C domain-containing protein [Anaerolineales bacterium]|nr:Het-C domain-containing protein [Anaerolineales bacterium]NUQ83294.1 hypothetical protein [Anaerolineales bacterium]
MLSQYHIEIMLASLGGRFSPRAMSVITHANINQDRIAGQFGHDEYHFDNNAFDKSYAYIEEQRAFAISSLRSGNADAAWQAFGRLLHTAQDFYAHSNYITLWLSRFDPSTGLGHAAPPPPPEVDPMDPSLIHSPDLRSGKVYYPFELLYFVRQLRPLALRILPRDSHAWMNLDSPAQGFKFDYAIQAAVKRTVIEFEITTQGFSEEMRRLFLDGQAGG